MVPDIRDEDILEVEKVLRSGMLVQGKKVLELEDHFAEYVGTKYAVAVSNGTASLHIALKAHGIGKGDEVIVPAFSYIATANVVELVGATPVFVDIDLSSYNIDVDQIESKITERTKAIIPVHEFGLACDISRVVQIAQKYDLIVIEDAACGLGAKFNNQHVGGFGEAGSFSFHPRKAITGGEGGMLVTNSSKLAEKFKVLRNHGISEKNRTEFIEAGFNYRMTDIQAALINSQFSRIDQIIEYKQKLANIYIQELAENKNLLLPSNQDNNINHAWQSFHVMILKNSFRDKLISGLNDIGIGTNYGAQCIPYQEYYQKKYSLNCDLLFPNSMRAFKNGLVLPLYEKMSEEDVSSVAQNLLSEFLNC